MLAFYGNILAQFAGIFFRFSRGSLNGGCHVSSPFTNIRKISMLEEVGWLSLRKPTIGFLTLCS